ncbi:MAG: DsbA family protein [Nitrospina sp.]|nr:DsbA family protein [Nitrospina sp.]
MAWAGVVPSVLKAEEPSGDVPVYSNNPVVAVVEDQAIYLNDLRDAQIHELMMQVYQLQKRKLIEISMKVLAEQQPQLKPAEPDPVTREDIVKFYEATAEVRSMGSLEQMEANIRQYLEGVNHEVSLKKLGQQFQGAVIQGHIQNYFQPPSDFRLVAGIGSAMRWFPKDSDSRRKVFLLEYSDFQCPFCKRVQPTLKNLRKKYASDVQFGYRHFPLPFHEEATRLAEAVECAREQDRFWEFQSLIYKNADFAKNPDLVFQLAQKAGVKDISGFEECWGTGKYKKRVQQDVQAGAKIGIRGTPTFIIGQYNPGRDTVSGEMFSGAVSEEKFISVIEKYLSQ